MTYKEYESMVLGLVSDLRSGGIIPAAFDLAVGALNHVYDRGKDVLQPEPETQEEDLIVDEEDEADLDEALVAEYMSLPVKEFDRHFNAILDADIRRFEGEEKKS